MDFSVDKACLFLLKAYLTGLYPNVCGLDFMHIIILSRGYSLYSTQSLLEAGLRRGHRMEVVDHLFCNVVIQSGRPRIMYDNRLLPKVDAVIPRIGASVTFHGAAVIRQLESMRVFTTLRADALQQARDKLYSLQLLSSSGIDVPKTFFASQLTDLPWLIEGLGGLPVVIKLLESTHGAGVILAENKATTLAILEAFQKTRERVLVQEFIKEAAGSDIRAFVVGDEIVASMKRQSVDGDFRSNLHRGATAELVQLTEEEKEIVLKSTNVLGLKIAGVDLLRSKRGPLVMEVNASPGLEGIETITGVKIADKIIEFVETGVKKRHHRLPPEGELL